MLKSETHNNLSHKGILDMAVDGTKLLTKVLSLVDHLVKGDLRCISSSVVATVGNNLGVVGGATAVPGKELKEIVSMVFLIVLWSRKTTYVRSVRWDVVKSTLGSDANEVLLELLGSDVCDSKGRVFGRLERDKVGQQASNVRGSHRGTRDGVDGVLAASPGGQNVQTRGEDVGALSVVGEVSTLISKSRGTNSHDILSSRWGGVAGISVVITSSNGEVETSVNAGVDGNFQNPGLSTTETHVGNTALEALSLALLGSIGLLNVRLNGPLDTLDDIRHGTRARRSEDLDGIDVGLLGDTVLLTSDGSGAVGSVSIAISVLIVGRDSLSPAGTALEVNMVNVDTSVNSVGINSLTTISGIQVLVEGTKREAVPVGDTGQTPGSTLLDFGVFHRVDFRVFLNEFDLMNPS